MRIRREPRLRTPPDRLLAVEAFESGGFFSTATTVGLTLGLALMVMIYAVGRVSGAHVNPVVSVGAAVGGRLAWNQVPVYVASQLVGAVLGAAVLFGLLHGFENFQAEGGMGQNAFGSESPANYALWAALLLELVLTTVFVWVILAVTDARNAHPALAQLAIGFTLVAIHFVAIPATGTSVNPSRSIGPALFAGGDALAQVWLFVVGPRLGGTIAGLLMFGHGSDPVVGSGLRFGRPAGSGRLVRGRAPVDPRADRRVGGPAGAGITAAAARRLAPGAGRRRRGRRRAHTDPSAALISPR